MVKSSEGAAPEKSQWTWNLWQRLWVAVTLGLIFSAIGFRLGNTGKIPRWLRYLVSPGHLTALWPVSGDFAHAMNVLVARTLVFDLVYYTILVFILLTIRFRR